MAAPEIVNLLRAIADLIEKSDPEQVKTISEMLSHGFRNTRDSSRMQLKAIRPTLSNISERLVAATTRDEAHHVLESFKLTRAQLSQLSREHSVHIVKEDNVSTIESKIVEALVGSRLNSKAIRGDR